MVQGNNKQQDLVPIMLSDVPVAHHNQRSKCQSSQVVGKSTEKRKDQRSMLMLHRKSGSMLVRHLKPGESICNDCDRFSQIKFFYSKIHRNKESATAAWSICQEI